MYIRLTKVFVYFSYKRTRQYILDWTVSADKSESRGKSAEEYSNAGQQNTAMVGHV